MTLKYMDMKGIQNVRGGSFCQIKITSDLETLIKRMLNGSKDRCFRCGSSGHFVKDCYNPRDNPRDNLREDEILDCVVSESDTSNTSEDLLKGGEIDIKQSKCPCFCVIL